jgi:hypothetical protein
MEAAATGMGWPGSREEEYRQAMNEAIQVDGYDSIEEWADAHGMTLDEALDEGVGQDDGGTVWVPPNLYGWLELEGRVK